MDEVKVVINNEEYTESQFEKDIARMFDSYRNDHMGSMNCDGVYCGDCPYKFRINCKENLRDDLLFHVKELREENDRLRYSKGMFEEAIKNLPTANNIKEDIEKRFCEQNEQLMK